MLACEKNSRRISVGPSVVQCLKGTRVIFYVRRIGLFLYKYRIYGTISIYILKGLAFVYQLI